MRLPPLNAVRSFEAAGRHASFSRAAVELHVTPGAVSRQIAKLEAELGVALFDRGGAEVRLTPEGTRFLAAAREALDRLRAAMQEVAAHPPARPLHIWGSRFFIRLWLLPRLPAFHALHPAQQVMISTATPGASPPEDVDIAITSAAAAAPPGMRVRRLMPRAVVPVCSPDYLRNAPPLSRPDDLEHHTLLQSRGDAADWQRWVEAAAGRAVPLPRRIDFTSADIAYSAALDGLGLALGRLGFIEPDLQAGRLVRPFATVLPGAGGFDMLHADAEPLPPRVALFRDWILGQLAGG